jgi:hypothetical protein
MPLQGSCNEFDIIINVNGSRKETEGLFNVG